MARGYGMSYTGRGVGRFLEGVKAGLGGGQEYAMREQQMRNTEEDREYLRGQRSREARMQVIQDEFAQFNLDLRKALGGYVSSKGANYQPVVDLYNTRYPSDHKLNVIRNDDGTFNIGTVDAEGKPTASPGKATFDEFGMLAYTMSNPELYFQNKIKREDQKGRFRESDRGVLDTASGTFKPHPPGLGMKGGKQKPVRYPQRTMVLDAGDIIKSDQELSQLSKEDQDALAFNTAARAQALLAEQPGIDAATAMSQALEEEAQNIAPGEKREFLGMDWLARDVAPAYRDRRKSIGMSGRPANTPNAPADRPIRIQNDDDFNRLPPGTLFTGPDGVPRRKPGAAPGAALPGTVPPPAQRKVGQTFDTPRGPMKWTGTGWMPTDAETYFRALRERPENNGVSDADLRAYVNQKFMH